MKLRYFAKYVNLSFLLEHFYFFTFLNRSDAKMKSFNAWLLEVITCSLFLAIPSRLP